VRDEEACYIRPKRILVPIASYVTLHTDKAVSLRPSCLVQHVVSLIYSHFQESSTSADRDTSNSILGYQQRQQHIFEDVDPSVHVQLEGTWGTTFVQLESLPTSHSSMYDKPALPRRPSSVFKRFSASHQKRTHLPIRIWPELRSKYHLLIGLSDRLRHTRSRPSPRPCLPPLGFAENESPRPYDSSCNCARL
jgi:hypothetical protein